ncbi:hypothetical protein RCL1_007575 [Eukaryota sp. TZLM3-RCL]
MANNDMTSWKDYVTEIFVEERGLDGEVVRVQETHCNIPNCRFKYTYRNKLYTSSIISHCEQHSAIPEILNQLKKCKKSKFFQPATELLIQPTFESRPKNPRRPLIKLFINNFLSFNLVDDIDFRTYLLSLNPSAELISRNTLKKEIINTFTLLKEELKTMLKNKKSKLNLTMDGWTSNTGSHFMGVTAHFLDQFEMKTYVLGFFHLKEKHTGENIAAGIKQLMSDLEITNKVLSITVDNARNMKRAMEILREDGLIKFWRRCNAHVLNLIVQEGMTVYNRDENSQVIDNSVERAREFAKKLHTSSTVLEKFRSLLSLEDIDRKKTIPSDVPHRWNSTFLLLTEYMQLQTTVERVMIGDESLEYLKIGDYYEINNLLELLSPFYKITLELSKKEQVTSGEFMVLMDSLGEHLVEQQSALDQKIKERTRLQQDRTARDDIDIKRLKMVNLMIEKMYQLSDQTYDFHYRVATAMDPGIKLECAPLTNAEKVSFKQRIRETLMSVAQEEPNENVNRKRRSGLLGSVLEKHRNEQLFIRDELEDYLREPILEDDNILNWWAANEYRFPELAKIAADYLSIQPSSVPCEQLFSVAGRVVSKDRASLSDESVDAIMSLYSWFKCKELDSKW